MTEQHMQNQYRPSTVSPPGTTLGELLEERGIRQIELATRMGVTPKFVNELIGGKATITPTTALALEKALDVPASFWLARDARYQEALARQASQAEMAANVDWLNELPLKDLRKFKWIPEQESKPAYVEACLRFFGVVSVDAWRQQYVTQTNASAAYRASEKVRKDPGSVAAWLRAGELLASRMECQPFDRDAFLEIVNNARKLTLVAEPSEFVPALRNSFAGCGVAVVIVRAPKGCPISGAVRWLTPQKALVQLSMRYLRNDTFWFTFFHECGHIALHGKKMLFLENDEMTGAEEDEANRFAADQLIPPNDWSQFLPYTVTEQAIRQFADRVGIAPGIVLGRLQKERGFPWNRFTHLKVQYVWKEDE
jgi:HTH-type transcriptional regulator / antitoxin HigA